MIMLLPSEQVILERASRSISQISYHNKVWFKKIYIDEKINPRDTHIASDGKFEIGRVYCFTYSDPKYKETLPFYSTFPLGMFIGYCKDSIGNPMFLNIWFVPPKIRSNILDRIYQLNMNAINESEEAIKSGKVSKAVLDVKYSILVKELKNSGFEFAIRSYIIDRIKTEPRIVSFNDIWRILTFPSPSQFLEKKGANEIYRAYKKAMGLRQFKKESLI